MNQLKRIFIYLNYIKEGNINYNCHHMTIEMIKLESHIPIYLSLNVTRENIIISVKIHRKSFKTSNV